MLSVFVCDACPLAFEVGGHGYWDCSGRQEQVVCTGCGTMHRLVERNKVCRVFALPGPAWDVDAVSPPESAWQPAGEAVGADEWRRLPCAACRRAGLLRSRERLPRQVDYPEAPVCPRCKQPVRLVSSVLVN